MSLAGRVFKTAWFSRAAKKARIQDEALCVAVEQAMLGQADDLGGGVFKKRLNENMHRALILAKGRQVWVYAYIFAKKDRANIDDDELASFRRLAKIYGGLTGEQVDQLQRDGEWTEICNGDQT